MKPKTLALIGGILLMAGAAAPWATLTSSFLGATRSVTGLEGDGILTGLGGLILLLIGLFAKEKPGQTFSGWGTLVSLACGVLIAWKVVDVSTTKVAESVSLSLGIGLTCFSPLGALLGLIGSAMRTPVIPTPVPQPPVDTSAPTAGSTS